MKLNRNEFKKYLKEQEDFKLALNYDEEKIEIYPYQAQVSADHVEKIYIGLYKNMDEDEIFESVLDDLQDAEFEVEEEK